MDVNAIVIGSCIRRLPDDQFFLLMVILDNIFSGRVGNGTRGRDCRECARRPNARARGSELELKISGFDMYVRMYDEVPAEGERKEKRIVVYSP